MVEAKADNIKRIFSPMKSNIHYRSCLRTNESFLKALKVKKLPILCTIRFLFQFWQHMLQHNISWHLFLIHFVRLLVFQPMSTRSCHHFLPPPGPVTLSHFPCHYRHMSRQLLLLPLKSYSTIIYKNLYLNDFVIMIDYHVELIWGWRTILMQVKVFHLGRIEIKEERLF